MSSPSSADNGVTSQYFTQDKEDTYLSAASSVSQSISSRLFQRVRTDKFSSSSSISETSRAVYWESNNSDSTSKSNICLKNFSDLILECEYQLSVQLEDQCSTEGFCSNVKYVYNPLKYANNVHSEFLKKYCCGPKDILFLGMNPGPWGMMQTGVPFGEISIVRDWLKVNGIINAPEKQHPLRPITGFNCKRSEVSGKRFWDLAKNLSEGDPNIFLRNCFIYNYFPLSLLTDTGKNITPADLPRHALASIHSQCDEVLCDVVMRLESKIIIAIGRYAEKRAAAALKDKPVKIVYISHPSPRNPKSNKHWIENTIQELKNLQLLDRFN